MKLTFLTMRDTKVGIYLQPFAVLSVPSGIRDLGELVNQSDKQLPWQKFPEDFEVYRIGTFDGDTGKIVPQEPEFLMILGNLKQP